MRIGIYLLKFKGTDQVYVGQSVNIDRRFTIHLRKLHNNEANYKLQKAYTLYGEPELEVLIECSREELNNNEAKYFIEYNSIKNGFNIATEPNVHLEGPRNGAAKYTEDQIIDVFELLLNVENMYRDIAVRTNVSEDTVRHIANSEAHTWLAKEFPDKYKILEDLKGYKRQVYGNSSKAKGIVYPEILSPTGEVFQVEIISTFAKQHGLDPSCLSKVLRSVPKYKSHKGWKLK